MKLLCPEWIIDTYFCEIADDAKLRKIYPILESEILEIFKDPQIQLLEENVSEISLSFPELLDKQY